MRFLSSLSTIVSLSSWRLRLVALEVRMWRFMEWPRLILPVAVFLKRFAAPLWVFIFGITSFHYNINARSRPVAPNCANLCRPYGTRICFPAYPALRLRLRAGLNCFAPMALDFRSANYTG